MQSEFGLSRRSGRGVSLILATTVALLVAGCGDKAKVKSPSDTPAPPAPPRTSPSATAPAANLTPAQRYDRALSLMQHGQGDAAKAELQLIQQLEPRNRRVAMLLRQLDTDPRQLYGGDSFVITIKAGDTLFSLAKKYLHDPLNFYGLARFNNLVPPVELQPGRSFSIPGRVRMPERPARRTPPAATNKQASPAVSPEAATPVVDNAANRAQAQRLRAQGLEQMSAGSIDRAVTLLSQASSLDPSNQATARDLGRARRIQATVRSR